MGKHKKRKASKEGEILNSICAGKKYKDVAIELGVTPGYVSLVARRNGLDRRRNHHSWTVREERLLLSVHTKGVHDLNDVRARYFPDVSIFALKDRLSLLSRREKDKELQR